MRKILLYAGCKGGSPAKKRGISKGGKAPFCRENIKVKDKKIAEKSKTLSDYEIFVYLVREYCKSMGRDEAIERAVKECISDNVLKKFLEERSREITSMIFGEWDWDVAKEVWQEEAREEGKTEGMEIGREEILSLMRQGKSAADIEKHYSGCQLA